MSVLSIQAPFDQQVASSLRSGTQVLISGTLIAARDAAHKKLVELIALGKELPCDLTGQVIYYVGPSPAKPGAVIGAAGPTTASRMDSYTEVLLAHGVRGMIGKGYRSEEVVAAIMKYQAPYLAAIGGCGALIAQSIMSYEVVAWPKLGTEALARLTVKDFPAIVVIDSLGHNLYHIGQARFRKK